MSAHRWLKVPKRDTSTRSPGARVFSRLASHAPVPLDGNTKTCADSVRKIVRRSARMDLLSAGKFAPRWSSMERIIERWMRSGTFVGPGM